MPFRGAMSRRVIAINLKHSIPGAIQDPSLDEMMQYYTAPMQLKCITAYFGLLAKKEKPVLNAVWPDYFQKQQIEMENSTQPICAFLRDLPNHTRTGWCVVPTTTPELRHQRARNYVPVSKIQYLFQRWCSNTGVRAARWDPILWQEAMDMNKLHVRNKRLPWQPAPGDDMEIIKRDYVFGILAPEQPNQPGAGQTVENQDVDDLEDEEEAILELDIQDAIQVNGQSLRDASQSSDPLGVMRGVNNALDPHMVGWLWENGVNRRRGRSNQKSRMITALVQMIETSNLAREVTRELSRRSSESSRNVRRRSGSEVTQGSASNSGAVSMRVEHNNF